MYRFKLLLAVCCVFGQQTIGMMILTRNATRVDEPLNVTAGHPVGLEVHFDLLHNSSNELFVWCYSPSAPDNTTTFCSSLISEVMSMGVYNITFIPATCWGQTPANTNMISEQDIVGENYLHFLFNDQSYQLR